MRHLRCSSQKRSILINACIKFKKRSKIYASSLDKRNRCSAYETTWYGRSLKLSFCSSLNRAFRKLPVASPLCEPGPKVLGRDRAGSPAARPASYFIYRHNLGKETCQKAGISTGRKPARRLAGKLPSLVSGPRKSRRRNRRLSANRGAISALMEEYFGQLPGLLCGPGPSPVAAPPRSSCRPGLLPEHGLPSRSPLPHDGAG